VFLILNQRYGPRLGAYGFDNVSATHLEYRRAIKVGVPIYVYVRDRLEAEYAIWRRNSEAQDLKFSWTTSKDIGIFELLKEHAELDANIPRSNWYSTFSSSVDLKAVTGKFLEDKTFPDRLVEAIHRNQFPLFDIEVDAERGSTGAVDVINVRSILTNVGGAPAFNFRMSWEDEAEECTRKYIIAAGQSVSISYIVGVGSSYPGADNFLTVQYESPIGVSVQDRFRVGAHIQKSMMISGGTLVSRRFHRVPPMSLTIEDT
jgi:hypothetical protein